MNPFVQKIAIIALAIVCLVLAFTVLAGTDGQTELKMLSTLLIGWVLRAPGDEKKSKGSDNASE